MFPCRERMPNAPLKTLRDGIRTCPQPACERWSKWAGTTRPDFQRIMHHAANGFAAGGVAPAPLIPLLRRRRPTLTAASRSTSPVLASNVWRNVSGLSLRQLAVSPAVIDRLVGRGRPVCGGRPCPTVGQCLRLSREPDPVVGVAIAREYLGDETHSQYHTGAAPDCLLVLISVRSA